MKAKMTAFEALMYESKRAQERRKKRAPKHKCKPKLLGTISRYFGARGKPLKRPTVCVRCYECEVCGRVMKGGGE